MPSKNENFRIITQLSKLEMVSRLEKYTGKESITTLLSGKRFTGTIDTNKIYLKTFDSPPIELRGKIMNEEGKNILQLNVKTFSKTEATKGLIYGLGYPLVFCFIVILIIYNPKNMSTYVISLIAGILPYIWVKYILPSIEPNPNSEMAIELIRRELEAEN